MLVSQWRRRRTDVIGIYRGWAWACSPEVILHPKQNDNFVTTIQTPAITEKVLYGMPYVGKWGRHITSLRPIEPNSRSEYFKLFTLFLLQCYRRLGS